MTKISNQELLKYVDFPSSTTLANFVGSVLSHSLNSGHTATLRSAQMLGFASHFACPRPLGEIATEKIL